MATSSSSNHEHFSRSSSTSQIYYENFQWHVKERFRNRPAILRVWGYVSELQPRTGYTVSIHSHDDADKIDLSRANWFEAREAVRYPANSSMLETRRFAMVRLDRLSNHNDWDTVVRVVDCKVALDRWEPICFCLVNNTSSAKGGEKNGMDPWEDGDWNVPVPGMTKAFDDYLERCQKTAGDSEQTAPVKTLESGRVFDKELSRGRRRRANRRHGIKAHATLVSNGPAPQQSMGASSTLAFPATIKLDHGRLRRRQRRIKNLGLCSEEVGNQGKERTSGQSQREMKVSASPTCRILQRIGAKQLGPENAHALKKLPILWIDSILSGDPSKMLQIPVRSQDDGHCVGFMVLPQSRDRADVPWKDGLLSHKWDLSISRFYVVGNSERCPAPTSYWHKFFIDAFADYMVDLRPSRHFTDRPGDIQLLLAASLNGPELLQPDSSSGPLAARREYLSTYLKLSSAEIWVDGPVGSDTARLLRWLPGVSTKGLNNEQERPDELPSLDVLNKRPQGHVFSRRPDLPSNTMIDDELFVESEYRFAAACAAKNKSYLYGDVTMINGRLYPSIIGNTSRYHELFYLTREVFYGAKYLNILCQDSQEAIARQFQAIAEDPTHSPDVRAHVMFECGLLLLHGIGVGKNHKAGLEWITEAASAGSRKSRAVLRRLHRSYGLDYPREMPYTEWLAREVRHGSYWAFEDVLDEDRVTLLSILRDAVFHRKGSMDEDVPGYFQNNIQDHFDMENPVVLEEQLKAVGSVPSTRPGSPGSQNQGVNSQPFSLWRTAKSWICCLGHSSSWASNHSSGSQQSRPSNLGSRLFDYRAGSSARGYIYPAQDAGSPPRGGPPPPVRLSATGVSVPAQIPFPLPSLDSSNQASNNRSLAVARFSSQFFNAAIRWTCCYGTPEVLQVLHEAQKQWQPDMDIGDYVPLALAAGRADVALTLLQALTSVDKLPYLLFQLHHLAGQDVESVARAVISKGYDINKKVDLYDDRILKRDRLSVFCDSFDSPALSFEDYFRHWAPELKGASITPLRWAIFHGNESLVKALLSLGAEFSRLPDVETYIAAAGELHQIMPPAFQVAVLDEPCFNVHILEMFFKIHGNQEGSVVFSETPLGLVVMEPDGPERRLRLGRQGSPENLATILSLMRRYQPNSDAQLFWAAAMNDHLDIVQYLITEGVDIEARHAGQTPLHTAVLHGRKSIFQLLLQSGADVHALTSHKRLSVMHLLFWKPKPLDTETFMFDELLQRLGRDFWRAKTSNAKIQPIHLATLNARIHALEKMVKSGADPCCPIGEDVMPSIKGIRHAQWGKDNLSVRDLGLDNDGDARPSIVSIEGLTPIGIILARCDMFSPDNILKMLDILISSPTSMREVYTRPMVKQTVFHLLPCHRPLMKSGIFRHLLERCKGNLDNLINVRDAEGDTPLHYASIFSGSVDPTCIDRLIDLGADPQVSNIYGMTPRAIQAWALIRQGQESLSRKDMFVRQKEIRVTPSVQHNGTSRPEITRNVSAPSRDEGQHPEVVELISQLLKGTDVVDILDLHSQRSLLPPKAKLRVQMHTEADILAEEMLPTRRYESSIDSL